jgi:hypothetical protein
LQIARRTGELTKISSRAVQRRLYILTSDTLFYAARPLMTGPAELRGSVPLGSTWIVDLPDTRKVQFGFQIAVTGAKTYTVTCGDEAEKQAWMDDIDGAIAQYCDDHPDCERARRERGANGAAMPEIRRPKRRSGFLAKIFSADPAEFDPSCFDGGARVRRQRRPSLAPKAASASASGSGEGGGPAAGGGGASASAAAAKLVAKEAEAAKLAAEEAEAEDARRLAQRLARGRTRSTRDSVSGSLAEFQKRMGYVPARPRSDSLASNASDTDNEDDGSGTEPFKTTNAADLRRRIDELKSQVKRFKSLYEASETRCAGLQTRVAELEGDALDAQLAGSTEVETVVEALNAAKARTREAEARIERETAARVAVEERCERLNGLLKDEAVRTKVGVV